jgi:hypothetical protein
VKMKIRTMMSIFVSIALSGAVQAALVGEWNFNSQTFANSGTSGAVHDGTFVTMNSNYFSTDAIDGSGYALRIQSIEDADNVDTTGGDVLLINNSSTSSGGYLPTFDGSVFTISMWVKSLDDNWTKWDEIASKQIENWESSPNAGWSVRSTDGNTIRFDAYGAGSAESTADALDLTWHLITVTYDGSAMNLYIDGVLEGSTNSVISDASLYALAFGAREDGSRGEDILIDEIQYYDEALSAAEVLALYTPQTSFIITPLDTALELTAPATLVTGSVAVSCVSESDIEVSVSITNSTHPGAFSVISATPQMLTAPSSASTVFEVEFDNSEAGLVVDGETASCEAVFAWNAVGSAVVTEVLVPINLLYEVPDENITIEQLGDDPAAVNPVDLTAEGSTDWVMLGRDGDIAAREEKTGAAYIGAVTVIGTPTAYAGNAYLSSWTDGTLAAADSGVQGGLEAKPPAVDGKQALTFSVEGLVPGEYTMKLYCSRYRASGTLTATNNMAIYSVDFDEGGVGSGSSYGVITLTFPIGSISESLDVSLDVTALGHSVYGNVSITAITLAQTFVPDPTIGEISMEMISGGTEVALSWDTSYGDYYGVMASGNLAVSSSWSNIITGVLGTGGEVTVTNTLSEGVEFYRAYIQD